MRNPRERDGFVSARRALLDVHLDATPLVGGQIVIEESGELGVC
jgi:hypothetical protein